MLLLQIILLFTVVNVVYGLPCLSNESKEDFDKSIVALSEVQRDIGKVIKKLEINNKKTIDMFKETLNSMGKKMKILDTDFKVLGKDFRKTKWHKYNGHCYYFSADKCDWFTAERKCKKLGGYLIKIDNYEENTRIYSNRPNSGYLYWIGLTDLKEGVYRWSYDQTKPKSIPWVSGYGSKGTNSNCVKYNNQGRPKWYDYDCNYIAYYICESNFCF